MARGIPYVVATKHEMLNPVCCQNRAPIGILRNGLYLRRVDYLCGSGMIELIEPILKDRFSFEAILTLSELAPCI
jgi:hypothetical protein